MKASSFSDGTAIPVVNDSVIWKSLTTPAVCNYKNNSSNSASFGKLYNWYTAIDPRNVCPAGWHVSSDEDWISMESYLGMPFSQLDSMGWRGASQNVGGKLKALSSLWTNPNSGANDESGFSGLAGGTRDGSYSSAVSCTSIRLTDTAKYYINPNFSFSGLNSSGTWWTSNEASVQSCSEPPYCEYLYSLFPCTNIPPSNGPTVTFVRIFSDNKRGLYRKLSNGQNSVLREGTYRATGNSIRCVRNIPVQSPGIPGATGREAQSILQNELSVESVRLNPNPANTEVNLEISCVGSGDCRIEITDMLGKVLLDENRSLQPGDNVLSYDIRNFRNGIYQVRVLRGSSRKVYRLVKN